MSDKKPSRVDATLGVPQRTAAAEVVQEWDGVAVAELLIDIIEAVGGDVVEELVTAKCKFENGLYPCD